jgi:deazaflavin-dependent oxidoreductase (nitroreductase family)
MPLPRALARFNRRVTNRIIGPIAPFLPTFGTITHRGRKSGRTYRTPIVAFRSVDRRRLVFALTYGRETDWVKNILADGHAEFDSRSFGTLTLTEPAFVQEPARGAVPWLIRRFLRLTGVTDFLETTIEP